LRKAIVEHNFTIAREAFGIPTLKLRLDYVLSEYSAEIQASRKRIEKSKMIYSV